MNDWPLQTTHAVQYYTDCFSFPERGSTFAYSHDAPPTRAVSVTMPLRLESWSVPFGLLPVFEMNLPEGALRERLRLAFAKATGTFDEFDLLSIVGRSQIGRIRYTGDKGTPARGRALPVSGRDSRTQTRRRPLPLPAGEIRVLLRD
jgi:HipA-like protein